MKSELAGMPLPNRVFSVKADRRGRKTAPIERPNSRLFPLFIAPVQRFGLFPEASVRQALSESAVRIFDKAFHVGAELLTFPGGNRDDSRTELVLEIPDTAPVHRGTERYAGLPEADLHIPGQEPGSLSDSKEQESRSLSPGFLARLRRGKRPSASPVA